MEPMDIFSPISIIPNNQMMMSVRGFNPEDLSKLFANENFSLNNEPLLNQSKSLSPQKYARNIFGAGHFE